MYTRSYEGWLKHWDFMLLDILCLQTAFILSYLIRNGIQNPFSLPLLRGMAFYLLLVDIAVLFFCETLSNVLRRGYYEEFIASAKHVILVELLTILYLFTIKATESYSRIALFLMGGLYFAFTYVTRIVLKSILIKKRNEGIRSLLLVTTTDIAAKTIDDIMTENLYGFRIAGVILADRDGTGENISGVPVVATLDNAAEYVCREWIDEVFINLSSEEFVSPSFVDQMVGAGVTVHLNLARLSSTLGKKQIVEKIGGHMVLTTSMNYISPKEELFKRIMDIAGGLVGCILTGILFIFLAPAIYIQSPGPIFFKQERVGKNGKHFKMYKFRSMYMDAEERKKELMKYNRVKDDRMFKLEFDPRVIGNRILPDGTQKTGIGEFIRKYSLDEFPQFWNVLKGDMSLVGTRPPLVTEVELYESHHRARLAVKPGITGMWQVSGRSEITDFEEVVRLDTQYINEWTIGLDLRILVKTIEVVFKKKGSM